MLSTEIFYISHFAAFFPNTVLCTVVMCVTKQLFTTPLHWNCYPDFAALDLKRAWRKFLELHLFYWGYGLYYVLYANLFYRNKMYFMFSQCSCDILKSLKWIVVDLPCSSDTVLCREVLRYTGYNSFCSMTVCGIGLPFRLYFYNTPNQKRKCQLIYLFIIALNSDHFAIKQRQCRVISSYELSPEASVVQW